MFPHRRVPPPLLRVPPKARTRPGLGRFPPPERIWFPPPPLWDGFHIIGKDPFGHAIRGWPSRRVFGRGRIGGQSRSFGVGRVLRPVCRGRSAPWICSIRPFGREPPGDAPPPPADGGGPSRNDRWFEANGGGRRGTALITGRVEPGSARRAEAVRGGGFDLILVARREEDRLRAARQRNLTRDHGVAAITPSTQTCPTPSRPTDLIGEGPATLGLEVDALVNNAGFANHGSFVRVAREGRADGPGPGQRQEAWSTMTRLLPAGDDREAAGAGS